MAPIIFTFLRPMADPTWYNQDGAVRTLIAAFNYFTLSPDAFHDWSLGVFISILAYNSIRVLIWLDHMGLRVATLVNLSFLGMDRLDRKLARFLGPAAATAQCIPEGVRRFATWAPLLIPFYLPRGKDWDFVWSRAEELQIAGAGTGLSVSPGKGLLIVHRRRRLYVSFRHSPPQETVGVEALQFLLRDGTETEWRDVQQRNRQGI